MRRSRAFPSVLLAAALCCTASAQVTWHVDGSDCAGARTGTADDPFCGLQEAVDAAASGDTVLVAPGTYVESVVLPGIALTLRATGGPVPTIVQAAGGPALSLSAGAEVWLEGLTFSGAGIRCDQSVLKVRACRFQDVIQYMGGAIWATESELIVRDTHFAGTRSPIGGGAILAAGCTLQLADCVFVGDPLWFDLYVGGALWLQDSSSLVAGCTFIEHQARNEGSAILVEGGRLTLEHSVFRANLVFDYAGTVAIREADAELLACDFRDNEAELGWGGAVYVSNPAGREVRILESRFERNSAAEGGAVCVHAGFVSVEGCRFAGNTTGASYFQEHGYGGGLLVGGLGPVGAGFAEVRGSVFVENVALGHRFFGDGRGGAVHGPMQLDGCTLYRNRVGGSFGDGPSGGTASGGATLENCIVWDGGIAALESGTAVAWSVVQGGWPGTGNQGLDPRFWDRAAGDLRLLPSSPCIDAGDPTRVDPDGSRLDIGALPFEPVRGSLARGQKSIR